MTIACCNLRSRNKHFEVFFVGSDYYFNNNNNNNNNKKRNAAGKEEKMIKDQYGAMYYPQTILYTTKLHTVDFS